MEIQAVRKAVIAGSWYPGQPDALRKDIEKYFNSVADFPLNGEIKGIVAPHAGYMYSGQVAAHAYKLVSSKEYDTVIIVGPSHRVAFPGVSVYPSGGYETPLGIVPVDEQFCHKIMSLNDSIRDVPAAHLQEHSIEIQLPFLQFALGDFSFVPLVMGEQNETICRELAEAIKQAARGKKILIVGSSDLSHFHDYRKAARLDNHAVKYLEKADANGLLRSLNDNSVEACGGGPMATAIMVAQKMGATKSHVLKYADSGDVSGDKSSVVGYAAAVYYL
ncbi:MAG TPA: AmmeMemoRadiSam system protein B [Deltaproteobacteria bacterium]|nr:AmmeMemoRadiSam system protein B [Deltaproteobacteria bacterium]